MKKFGLKDAVLLVLFLFCLRGLAVSGKMVIHHLLDQGHIRSKYFTDWLFVFFGALWGASLFSSQCWLIFKRHYWVFWVSLAHTLTGWIWQQYTFTPVVRRLIPVSPFIVLGIAALLEAAKTYYLYRNVYIEDEGESA